MSADSFHAVIVAAGEGQRLGLGRKAALEVAGAPLVCWSLATIAGHSGCAGGVLVVHPDDLEIAPVWLACAGADDWQVIAGGQTRSQSSGAGIAQLPKSADTIIVHDGARPALHGEDLDALLAAISPESAALLAEMETDSLYEARSDGKIGSSFSRQGLWRAQTPQGFRRSHLGFAVGSIFFSEGDEFRDEAALLLEGGTPVTIVEASHPNPKLTRRVQLPLIELILRQRPGEPPAPRFP